MTAILFLQETEADLNETEEYKEAKTIVDSVTLDV